MSKPAILRRTNFKALVALLPISHVCFCLVKLMFHEN